MTRKTLTALIAAIIVFAASIIMVDSYDRIQLIVQKHIDANSTTIIKSNLFYNSNISTSVYAIKNRLQNSENYPASDNVLTITGEELFVDGAKNVFDNTYYWYWNEHLLEDNNLHYYAIDHATNKEFYNNDVLKEAVYNENPEEYQFYVYANYGETGEVEVSFYEENEDNIDWSANWASLFDQSARAKIESYITRDTNNLLRREHNVVTDSVDGIDNQIKINPITNMTFVFAVPKTMESTGNLYSLSMDRMQSYYLDYSLVYALGLSAFVGLIFLFFPIKIVREWNWFKTLSSVKAEFLYPALFFTGVIVGYAGLCMVYVTQEGKLYALVEELQLLPMLNELSAFINVGVWAVYFFLIMFTAFMIRFIFNKGLFTYIKENTLLFWIIAIISLLIKKIFGFIDRILSFDLSDPMNKTVLKIVLFNFLVLSILCYLGVLGNILMVVYSIGLFFFIKHKLTKMQNDYIKLLDAAKQISEGNFNVPDEDAGVFNSLKDAFGEVKVGFEKAVNEEFKSQRMKTELISNVSHDLKTPLTSIITYVDLLKNNSLSEEARVEYINTIDRNSQRLKNLITDLFEISKANSGNVSLNLQDVDIVSLIHQVIFECQEKIETAKLDFKLNFNRDHILLKLDSLKTYRIFENLIINICKYALGNTRVYVDVTETEKQVKIIFKNISASELTIEPDEITERFVQGDKSRNTEGSGLGLAIVKSFTQLQNGDFHIEVDGDLFKAILTFNK